MFVVQNFICLEASETFVLPPPVSLPIIQSKIKRGKVPFVWDYTRRPWSKSYYCWNCRLALSPQHSTNRIYCSKVCHDDAQRKRGKRIPSHPC